MKQHSLLKVFKLNSTKQFLCFNAKKLLIIIFIFCFNHVSIAQSYTGYSNNPAENDGSTEAKSINIYTAGDLIYLSKTSTDWGKYFVLMADIDFGSKESVDWDNDGSATWDAEDQLGFSPIGDVSYSSQLFKGTFNGNLKTISNLYINKTTDYQTGFFRASSGTLKNIRIKNSSVTGQHATAILVGCNKGVVTNCSINGIVHGGNAVGGIIGTTMGTSSNISNCNFEGMVYGSEYVGGIAGEHFGNIIENCYAIATIYGVKDVGGLVGSMNNKYLLTSFFNGIVKGTSSVGGVSGHLQIQCSKNCYSKGAVIGDNNVGGAFGYSTNATNCYASGFVTGNTNVSGVVSGGTPNCFYDFETTGVPFDYNSYFQRGKSTDWFYDPNNFAIWGDTAWSYATGIRPFLKWEKVSVSNRAIRNNIIEGSFFSNPDITISETGVRFTTNEDPFIWTEEKNSDVNINFSVDMTNLAIPGKEYFAQSYVRDINGNTYYGDMIKFTLFEITYNANGGIDGTYTKEIVSNTENPKLVGNPTKENYHIVGWNTLENGQGINITTNSLLTSNIELFAQWQGDYYDVVFDANGGNGNMQNQTIAFNSTVALNSNTFTRTGYTFLGWSRSTDGSVEYNDGADYSMLTATNDTLYAKWAINSYDVVFIANSGEGDMVNQTIVYSSIAALNNCYFLKTGYSFAGWANSANGEIAYTDGADYTMQEASNDTLYAQWTANYYDIVFIPNNGEGTMTNQSIAYNSTVALKNNEFTRHAYTFKGWSTKLMSYVEYEDGDNYTMQTTENDTLYAQWTLNSYDVVFIANGGEGVMPNQTILYGRSDLLFTNTFTRNGYTFKGWAVEVNGFAEYADGSNYTMYTLANDTLYAQWNPNPYDVVFIANGGEGSMLNQTIPFNSTASLKNNSYTKTGSSFTGWSIIANGTVEYTDGADYSMLTTANDTLYAQWSPNNYDVVFIANGGEGSMSNQPIAYNSTSALITNTFTKTGYSFAGWATSTNGTIDYTDGAGYSMLTPHNDTLYAQWTVYYYEIIFISNGGEGTMPNQSIAYNATVTLNNNIFTKAGYTFGGWATSETGTVEYANSSNFTMQETNDIKLYAHWDINSGVETSEIINISIYPNPVSNILTIETEKDCSVELIDLNGRVLIQKRVETGSFDLPMDNQINGVYILRIIYNSRVLTKQIVKI
ncbi:MAG: T9SS type A sorting domain-containing protein [Bacteroidales bacterium]|nr:MAG: T9SS type A sorting domain-containing protein [Bacteroidales bacterium]